MAGRVCNVEVVEFFNTPVLKNYIHMVKYLEKFKIERLSIYNK
jgi:hypothetical protein